MMKGKSLSAGLAWLFLVFLAGVSEASAAGVPPPGRDSLMRVIRRQEGAARVKSLYLLAKSGEVNDTLSNEFILREIESLPEAGANEDLLEALEKTGSYFFDACLVKYSLPVVQKGLHMALRAGNYRYQLIFNLQLSQNFFFLHRIGEANLSLDQASRLADLHDLAQYKASILNTRANQASASGYTLEALNLYHQAAGVLRDENDLTELGIVYDNIGLLHMDIENYTKAIPAFLEAIGLTRKYGTEEALLNTYINLGVCYTESGSLVMAGDYYQKAVALSRKLQNEYQLARVFMNLANLNRQQKNYTGARAFLDSSMNLCQRNNIAHGVVFNLINLGELYLDTGRPRESLEVLLEAVRKAAPLTIPAQMAECYRLMSAAAEKLNLPGEALNYHKQYFSLSDSLHRAEKVLHAGEMENRMEMERSLREFSTFKENTLRARSTNQVLIISILALLLASGSAAFHFYLKRKKALFQARLAGEESDRLRLHVESKNRELASKAIHISAMNEVTLELGRKLKSLLPGMNREKAVVLQKIIRDLKKESPHNEWKEFEMRFEQVHTDFYGKLRTSFPALTPAELKVCSFLRLNLSSKEIAVLTNRSLGTIDNARSSIRRKMQLENDANLTAFLLGM